MCGIIAIQTHQSCTTSEPQQLFFCFVFMQQYSIGGKLIENAFDNCDLIFLSYCPLLICAIAQEHP